jgi:predicted RNA-binding protein with PUA-like domain
VERRQERVGAEASSHHQERPSPDPEDPTEKYVEIDVAPVKRLPRPVTLAEIKEDPGFKDFPLVRIARLSVMPVTDAEWARIERMAGKAPRGEP